MPSDKDMAKLTKLSDYMEGKSNGMSEEEHKEYMEETEKKYMMMVASEARLREEAECRLKEAKDSIESMARSLSEKQKELDMVKMELDSERQSNFMSQQKISDMETEINGLHAKASMPKSDEKYNAMHSTISALTNQVNSLRDELSRVKSIPPPVKKAYKGFDIQVTSRDGNGAMSSFSINPKE